jgi:hypothetical protein
MSRIFLTATAAAAVMLTVNAASASGPPATGLYEVTLVTTNTLCQGQPTGTVAAGIFNLGAPGTVSEYLNLPVASTSSPALAHIGYSTAFPNTGSPAHYVAGTWSGNATTLYIVPGHTTSLGTDPFTSTVTFNDGNTFFISFKDTKTGCMANQTFIRL